MLSPKRYWREPRSQEVGEERDVHLTLHCHHQNDSYNKMGSDDSHFNVNCEEKVTRQCPQTTTFEERGKPKRNRTEALLTTSLTTYRRSLLLCPFIFIRGTSDERCWHFQVVESVSTCLSFPTINCPASDFREKLFSGPLSQSLKFLLRILCFFFFFMRHDYNEIALPSSLSVPYDYQCEIHL